MYFPDTQLMREPDGSKDGWLINQKWLYVRRAPGNTCISAFMDARCGERKISQYGGQAENDSTGAFCGNILGALHGEESLPPQLVFEVEGRGTILELADDFVYEFTRGHELHGEYGLYTRWTTRYPGW